jgi:hypothetical protein
MRLAVLVLLVGQLAAQSPTPAERASQVLAEARRAMGGEKVTAITSILATGRTQRVRGDNLVPIEFEIAIELPDKYVRRDEIPAEESGPTTNGFAGTEIIQTVTAPAGRPGGPGGRPGGPPATAAVAGRPGGAAPAGRPGGAPPSPEARLNAAKQDFARLALGVFVSSLDTFPMTFAYAAQAQAPQGVADVLDVRGPGDFAGRLFIDGQSRLPIMLSWQAPAARGQGAPVENRLYYSDYRDVNGAKFPFRLRRAVGPDTTEETTFDRFRLNTRIDPRKFAVQR